MPLVQCLFYRHSHTAQKPIKGVTNAFMDRLLAYDWPGNIRELENTLRSAIALCKTDYLTTHELSDLGSQALTAVREDPVQTFAAAVSPFVKDLLNRKERGIYEKVHAALDQQLLGYVLSVAGENQSAAARLLGISRLTLRKKMEIS